MWTGPNGTELQKLHITNIGHCDYKVKIPCHALISAFKNTAKFVNLRSTITSKKKHEDCQIKQPYQSSQDLLVKLQYLATDTRKAKIVLKAAETQPARGHRESLRVFVHHSNIKQANYMLLNMLKRFSVQNQEQCARRTRGTRPETIHMGESIQKGYRKRCS